MLQNNILNTIKYFDIFAYPLTSWECYHWLYGNSEPVEYEDFIKELDRMVEDKELMKLDGFYFLPGREKNIQTRQRRYLLAQLKYNIAVRAVKIIRSLPYIKYIAVCNSLAYNNASEGSDIDLFVIAEAGKLWRARFVAATLMQLLRWRPTEKVSKDKICLSFLIADDGLDIEAMAIENDIYLKYWLVQLVPLYDPSNLQEKLMKANDNWLRKDLPNYLVYRTNDFRKVQDGYISKTIKFILESILRPKFVEILLRRFQFAILSNDLKTIANKDTRVVMNDKILKFHVLDRREMYRDKYLKRTKNV
ncbi:hypothetical protein ISR92_03820 [Patescibacteria group bacterium]|nr:hypothetical protein [Patescibacteria group bacterium]